MRAYYAEHKQDWDEVKARHILIRMQGSRVPVREGHKDLTDDEALAKAKEVRAKIVAGAKFDEISQDRIRRYRLGRKWRRSGHVRRGPDGAGVR